VWWGCIPFTDNMQLCLTNAQSGFRRLHSTVASLLNATNRWLENIDKGLVTAFDTVNNDIMLAKRKGFGINSTEHKWFSSHLTLDLNQCH